MTIKGLKSCLTQLQKEEKLPGGTEIICGHTYSGDLNGVPDDECFVEKSKLKEYFLNGIGACDREWNGRKIKFIKLTYLN